MEKAGAAKEAQLAAEVEELRRQLEGAGHELDEWRQQLSDASQQVQALQAQVEERAARLAAAEVHGLHSSTDLHNLQRNHQR